eukprot:Pgem_evm1s7952
MNNILVLLLIFLFNNLLNVITGSFISNSNVINHDVDDIVIIKNPDRASLLANYKSKLHSMCNIPSTIKPEYLEKKLVPHNEHDVYIMKNNHEIVGLLITKAKTIYREVVRLKRTKITKKIIKVAERNSLLVSEVHLICTSPGFGYGKSLLKLAEGDVEATGVAVVNGNGVDGDDDDLFVNQGEILNYVFLCSVPTAVTFYEKQGYALFERDAESLRDDYEFFEVSPFRET